jgi:Tfp pilus assembly protein PilV
VWALLKATGPSENYSMCQHRQVIQKGFHAYPAKGKGGFVLLEVLVAMSLILGVWMALIDTYQHLALRNAQEESKRVQLRKESDAFETGEHVRVNPAAANSKGLSHESSRVPSRNRTISVTPKPTSQKQR